MADLRSGLHPEAAALDPYSSRCSVIPLLLRPVSNTVCIITDLAPILHHQVTAGKPDR